MQSNFHIELTFWYLFFFTNFPDSIIVTMSTSKQTFELMDIWLSKKSRDADLGYSREEIKKASRNVDLFTVFQNTLSLACLG